MTEARFITFEGIDGAGKSTQIEVITETLRARGLPLVRAREPGGTPVGEKIRGMLLADAMDPVTETLLFFASRAELLRHLVRPSLQGGSWVLCDRFTDATYAYQVGGKGVPEDVVLSLERTTLGGFKPDLTVLFDIDPQVAAGRLSKARNPDRFEKESVAFFSRVREAYLERARREPGRFLLVDASRDVEAISSELKEFFASWP